VPVIRAAQFTLLITYHARAESAVTVPVRDLSAASYETGCAVAAGYSSTPQARKLGLKPGYRVRIDQPPDGWALEEAPELLIVEDTGPADVIVSFFRSAAELAPRLPALAADIYPEGALWIAWPRRAAGHRSDITENLLREKALPLGIVDVKVAALDDDWSALRFVWRVENRPPAPGR
jgi:hypothetical protein